MVILFTIFVAVPVLIVAIGVRFACSYCEICGGDSTQCICDELDGTEKLND